MTNRKDQRPAIDLQDTEEWLRNLETADPAQVEVLDTRALAGIARAVMGLEDARTTLNDAVRVARGQGFSWAMIATRLGVTRQAAFERFAKVVGEPGPPAGAPRSAEAAKRSAVVAIATTGREPRKYSAKPKPTPAKKVPVSNTTVPSKKAAPADSNRSPKRRAAGKPATDGSG